MNDDFLGKLLGISRQMAETKELDALLEYAIDVAIELVGAQVAYLVLVDENGNLDFRVRRDKFGQTVENPDENISFSILSKVISFAEPLVIPDAMADPNYQRAESVFELKLRSVMCVPLISRGNIIGAIYVENRSMADIFHDDDVEPLVFFAAQAAVAIENAMLMEELEARVDRRTRALSDAMEKLEQNWTEAVESNRIRTMHLANVAHDIRSPLSVVMTALSMLTDEELNAVLGDEQRTIVESAVQSAQHAINLTNDIFDLSKLESGKLTVYPEPVDLGEYLQQMYRVGQNIVWPPEVEFRLDLPDGLPTVPLDTTRIQQVIFNLLTNASKFTTQGSVTLYALKPQKGEVLIGVKDTGPGIPPDEKDKLFERFQQLSTGEVAVKKKGTGLGLAISKELVALHKGRIWVESTPGQGADFRFTLPVG